MRCPRCGEGLALWVCKNCGGETLEGSLYCCRCGQAMTKEEERDDGSAERIPCSDGNCIGTVNDLGICNVCGKPFVREKV